MECHSLNWKHIVNEVDHEMTHRVAQIIDSLSSEMEDLKMTEDGGSESADKLIKTINSKSERTLTDSETKYLRSLILRATKRIDRRDLKLTRSDSNKSSSVPT